MSLPDLKRVGICPIHAEHFYYPNPDDGQLCPEPGCPQVMHHYLVGEREDKQLRERDEYKMAAEAEAEIADEMRAAAVEARAEVARLQGGASLHRRRSAPHHEQDTPPRDRQRRAGGRGRMTGFTAAWNAYLCALQGHVWTWTSNSTGSPPPIGSACSRCGMEKR